MKCLAKYLPVEGEIKEGDTVIFPNGIIADVMPINKNSDGKFRFSMDAAQGADKCLETTKSLKGKEKKVKLFAVTQDIEVGEVQGIGQSSQGAMVTTKFEVLGELSPNATWEIKDGDEIEVAQEYIEEGISYYYENMDCKLSGIEKELAVLGPCGHYH